MQWGVLVALGVCLLCSMSVQFEDATIGADTVHDLGSGWLPKSAHDPTPAEMEKQVKDYRVKPNKGFIVDDRDRQQLRQPTRDEAVAATARSIKYHKRTRATLAALSHGGKVNATNAENEEHVAHWQNASSPDPISGADRYKLSLKQYKESLIRPVTKKPAPVGYTPEGGVPLTPRDEPVLLKDLTGRDTPIMLTPVVHMPSWAPCVSGPMYDQYFHKDLSPRSLLTDDEKSQRTWGECAGNCSSLKEKCLGYVRHDKGDFSSHDCWLIPASKFPAGLNSSVLTDWNHGSIWLKDMSTALRVKDCSKYKAPPNVLPLSDFGDRTEVTTAKSAQIAEIMKGAKVFYDDEVAGLESHPDQDMVDISHNISMKYRLQQKNVYIQERTQKAVMRNEGELLKTQERKKKRAIHSRLKLKTFEERMAEVQELTKERTAKKATEEREEKAKTKERSYKATPEGMLKDAEIKKAKEAVQEVRDKEIEAESRKYEAYVAEAHKNETIRLAKLDVNITKALNATKTGTASEEQIRFLDREGIPYRDDELSTFESGDEVLLDLGVEEDVSLIINSSPSS